MSFKIKTKREKKVEYNLTVDGQTINLWVSFKQPVAEEIDYAKIGEITKDSEEVEISYTEEKTGIVKSKKISSKSYNAFLYNLRVAITGWSDEFLDEDGNKLEFNEENQKIIFDAIKDIGEFFDAYITAYTGITTKN